MTKKEDKNSMMVLINGCYGGYSVSQYALEEYNKETGKSFDHYDEYSNDFRTDQIMCRIVEKLGTSANGMSAELCIYSINKKYEHYIKISEYDGRESIDIDFANYKLDQIKSIVQSSIDDKTKSQQIKNVILETNKEPILILDNFREENEDDSK